jgi:hypothetical protein
LIIKWPFESAYLLLMRLKFWKIIYWLSQVSLKNTLISWSTWEYWISPSNGTDSILMSFHWSHLFLLISVPNLHYSSIWANGEMGAKLRPLNRSDMVSVRKFTKLDYIACTCLPKVDTILESYYKHIPRGPVYQIKIKIV